MILPSKGLALAGADAGTLLTGNQRAQSNCIHAWGKPVGEFIPRSSGIYARKHLKVTRQRNEHALRLARNLCLANAKVVLEDLNISGLVINHKLAKSISDASWYNFRALLEYFGTKFGREVIAVPPHFTSQECSNCGGKVQKSLSTRTHSCPRCGHIEQRDVNAAKVILSRATTGGHPGSNEAWSCSLYFCWWQHLRSSATT
jgi:putative transposase